MILRDYQEECVEIACNWIKSRKDSAVLDLATGAGKSIIVAKLAEWFNKKTGYRVLCLAPSKELVEQNHAKYISLGLPASIYCASVTKSLAQNVVFGSPQTVANSLELFCEQFALVIIDECHGITPTIKEIITALKAKQKNLRVIGLSATPYRMNTGYVYQYDLNGQPVEHAKNPYFHQLIYRVPAQHLIDRGFLTKPVTADTHAGNYDTSGLTLNKMGNYDAEAVERAFEGHGRLTSAIVADVVENSRHCQGVVIFAATVKHAYEVLASLPEGSRIITGNTKKAERERIIDDFKAKRFKYLVNVAVLTTGFDAPHIDHVAILRATESAGLMQQIIGRGLRLADGKPHCLVSDYAGNIERHCPDGDLFNPKIKVTWSGGESEQIEAHCPACKSLNIFTARKNDNGFKWDKWGYFLDLAGNRIVDQETKQEYPAHYGRRCFGQVVEGKTATRCEYRWSGKKCPECDHHNDIAARHCEKCKHELIDPNEKLKIDFKRMKNDPYSVSTDKVLSWRVQEWVGKSGGASLRVDYTTPFASFSVWYHPEVKRYIWRGLCAASIGHQLATVAEFMEAVNGFEAEMPKTITCRKNKESGFYEVYDHNREEDVCLAV